MMAAAVSRGALSVSLILFVGLALLHKNFFVQIKSFAATPFLWSLSLLFFLPFVSGLWSDDLSKWSDVVRIKLPLLFLPLAFAGSWNFSKKQWLFAALFFLALVFSGCVWGLIDYAQNAAQIHEGYLRAKTLRTPLEGDHVRFSWLVSVAVILCLLLAEATQQNAQKVLLLVLCLFFVIYLHVLSARTGIFSLYLFLLVYFLHLLFKMKNRKRSALLFCFLIALPFVAYTVLPTFKARLRYNLYDLSFVQKAQYLPGSSDGARTMSLKAGWQVLRDNPFGAGAGDVMHEADKWYAAAVPNVLPPDKFYPSSEWLMYGAFAGWPGVLIFTLVMLVPFFVKVFEYKIYWIGFHATAAFSFLFDMGLEVQYGGFLYAFLACGLWKALYVRCETLDVRQE
ncbi:hypothetical protein GCM10023229_21050 [Flavisolibacter ginsenosidimutans]